jgi:hypothetical protein
MSDRRRHRWFPSTTFQTPSPPILYVSGRSSPRRRTFPGFSSVRLWSQWVYYTVQLIQLLSQVIIHNVHSKVMALRTLFTLFTVTSANMRRK